ncbi:MAG: hypothetical protein ACTSPW_03665 [Promethearchaeota archaeon]
MIIELPEAYQGIGYLQGTSLILWLISIGIFFTSFVLFILKALKLEMKSQKKIFQGYGIFSLFFGITRIIFIIGVYIPEQYDFYTTLGYITGILGILYWLYVIETYLITNTKKIFMLLPFAIVAIFMLYIYLIIKTTGIVRKRTIWLVIGLVILVIGYIMDTELFVGNFRWIPLEISPALMILGTLIFIITQLKE